MIEVGNFFSNKITIKENIDTFVFIKIKSSEKKKKNLNRKKTLQIKKSICATHTIDKGYSLSV